MENFDKPAKPIHIVFIIQLPKIAGGCQHFVGFQGGKWQSVHIDELLESNEQLPQIEQLVNRSVSDLFQSVDSTRADDNEDMDVDENQDVSLPSDSEELPMDGIEVKNSIQRMFGMYSGLGSTFLQFFWLLCFGYPAIFTCEKTRNGGRKQNGFQFRSCFYLSKRANNR